MVEFLKTTLANGTGSPVRASVTLPEIRVTCASPKKQNRQNSKKWSDEKCIHKEIMQ